MFAGETGLLKWRREKKSITKDSMVLEEEGRRIARASLDVAADGATRYGALIVQASAEQPRGLVDPRGEG